jgi:hypothetical protein
VAYGTAKTAQVKLTLHLLDEFRRWQKEAAGCWFAHVVCPGGVDTRVQAQVQNKARLLRTEDVADLCLELLAQPEHGLADLEKRLSGKAYAIGPVGVFERHEAIIRIWK